MSLNRFHCFNKIFQLSKRFITVGCSRQKTFVVNGSEDFIQNVLKSNTPAIVNFHAEWCEPCSTLTPMLKKIIGDLTMVDLAIVDVEKNADLVHTFEVKAVPAVLAIHNGHVVEKFIGLIDENMIKEMVEKMAKLEEK